MTPPPLPPDDRAAGGPDRAAGPDRSALPPRRFEGQTAIVTGAGSGIGRATAIRLATEGAAVGCLDIAIDQVRATVEALQILGGRAEAFACDVSDEKAVTKAVTATAKAFGRPSVLCNVAGVGGFAHTTEVSLATWQRFIGVNLTGTFLMSRQTLPYLLDGGGVIVNVASISGLMGQAYSAAYCASKGGVVLFTKALAIEYADRGVRVNAVAPGGVDTPLLGDFGLPDGGDPKHLFRSMSRMGYASPEQVAAAIAFLASDESGYTTGSILAIDGGITACGSAPESATAGPDVPGGAGTAGSGAMGHGVNQRTLIKMTPDEVEAFVHERRPMTLCSINHDGTIHAVAMWYGFVDGCVTIETKAKSQKAQNLRRNPTVTCLFEDGDSYEDLRGVEYVGRAEFVDDPDQIWAAGVSVFERYYGIYTEELRPFIETMLHKRVIVRVNVDRVVSWDHRKLGLPPTRGGATGATG